MGYSLALEKVCKIQGTHFLPSLAQEYILEQYSRCEMVPWGAGVVIPFLPLPCFETRGEPCHAHLCPHLLAFSASQAWSRLQGDAGTLLCAGSDLTLSRKVFPELRSLM